MPQAARPSAKGPDGVSVSSGADDPGVTIVLDKVTRRGGLLFGEFVVSGNDQKLKFLPSYFRDSAGFGLNNARGELGGVSSIVAASGVTLISGGNYVFPVDYLPVGADSHRPLADLNLVALSEDGRSARICMAWPDTGEKTVIVDCLSDSKYTPVEIVEEMGVVNYGQMTAGGWMYIGSQGIVHGIFNTILNACFAFFSISKAIKPVRLSSCMAKYIPKIG